MAINQTDIALGSCLKIVQATNQLLQAIDTLEVIGEQLTASGIDLNSYESGISSKPGINHCEPSTYKNILIFNDGLISAMKALYSGTPTQQAWTGFQKARTV